MKKRIVLLFLAAALALAAWKGKPLYQHLMAHRLLRSAEKANDSHEALRLYALAAKRAPADLVILRRFAAFLDQLHRPEVLQLRGRISQLEPENPEALLDFAEAALTFQNPKLAGQVLEQSRLPQLQENARYHHLRSVLHFIANELPQADAECERAIKLAPANESFRVNQATIRLSAPNAEARQSALATLDAIPKKSPSRFGALQSLLRYSAIASGEPEKLDIWSAEFRELISPDSPLFTIYLNVLRRWRPDSFPTQCDAYLKAAKTSASNASLAQKWLNETGAFEQLLTFRDTLPLEWKTAPESLLLYANSLFFLKKFEVLKASLTDPGWNRIEPLKQAWEERLQRVGQPENAEAGLVRWNAILAAAGNNAGWLTELTELAEQWRWKPEYERTLWVLSEKAPAKAPEALESLSKFYLGTGNGAGLLQVVKKQLSLRPDDAALQNNVAFLSFLLDVETSRADRLASDLLKRFPKAPSIIATAAFGKLKKGEFAEGLSLYKPLDVNKLRGTPSGVSYGLLLAAMGDRQGGEFLQNAESISHFPEERRLIEEARAKLQ